MHLKTLTLRGFKSFASSTTLHLEPGITCVVGPNGSGKSNVVDAIAWVLGEQGAKALRGGNMADVIFAGTPGRPPLGRAEVQLTIDNSDGALPLDYTEVTIGRLMYRSGESEYSVNGSPCRLLDVQELLSDSGIGRELHVVVGQGQLDAVLGARPEDRRAFIEEAAGVLKHRKRKEKALRKLETMTGNLARVSDLAGELRRQLGPLSRQAEAARKASVLSARLRDARLRLLADDIAAARARDEADNRSGVALRERLDTAEEALGASRSRAEAAEARLAELGERRSGVRDATARLVALQERLGGTLSLARERATHLAAEEPGSRGRDPAAVEAEAARAREAERQLTAEVSGERERLGKLVTVREQLEVALRAEDAELARHAKAVADRREGLATLAGRLDAARTRVRARGEEAGRLAGAAESARRRAVEAGERMGPVEAELAALDGGELTLDGCYEDAVRARDELAGQVSALSAELQDAERARAGCRARCDALAMSLTARDAAGRVLAAAPTGLLGPVREKVQVEPGFEAAVAAALGSAAADGVAMDGLDSAAAVADLLRSEDAGRAFLLLAGAAQSTAGAGAGGHRCADGRFATPSPLVDLPGGARWVTDLVTTTAELSGAVVALLACAVVVDGLDAACDLVRAHRNLRAVTPQGDVVSDTHVLGGSAGNPSVLELQAAADEAAAALAAADQRGEQATAGLARLREQESGAGAAVDAALAELHDSDARIAAVAEQLAGLSAAARAAHDEAERLDSAREAAERARDNDSAAARDLEERLANAQVAPLDEDRPPEARDRLRAEVAAARDAEVEARLALRTAEERLRGLSGRADSLLRVAGAERSARAAAQRRRQVRAVAARDAAAVATVAEVALQHLASSLAGAQVGRTAAEQAWQEAERELAEAREAIRMHAAQFEALRDAVHRDDVVQVERRLHVSSLEQAAVEEFGYEPQELVETYGPDAPVPPDEEGREPGPYVRAEQQERAERAEKALARLGRVNPLALEEYAALQERATFLNTQLRDLEATRRDLLHVVREVDERVRDAFRAAFADTAREFEEVFATLFPGGEGRLVLTDPGDMLLTGIEVEARPAGKKVRRLSLLSGGERSLTALALLLAIFRARPSPFYILDEVEAALDDRNLGRLLDVLEVLRERSQLVIITHQKRTMEIADALYGVSMRGDGVTTLISQRLRESIPA
ncbi:MAG: chromosome segregation protein SMC [Frankiaceae bacterium]